MGQILVPGGAGPPSRSGVSIREYSISGWGDLSLYPRIQYARGFARNNEEGTSSLRKGKKGVEATRIEHRPRTTPVTAGIFQIYRSWPRNVLRRIHMVVGQPRRHSGAETGSRFVQQDRQQWERSSTEGCYGEVHVVGVLLAG
ncbi:hypothetical protein M413DRAFT_261810 [Hebeloma cylindrosporum]|uniref:Uncharacterized protein n=1 Tax=Hebeloma cylindrosporum TaxID=76867 RepID=A0A0C3CRQ5_HEBCY|nr:hypothetical protein M413DRAFT_261810 [Hebeloma cylindrosporum h7]